MHPHARHLLTFMHRLGLWVALPLLLAVLPYQQASLQPSGQAAVSVRTRLALAAPLKASFVKSALPETSARSIPLLESAIWSLPLFRPGFRLLAVPQPIHPIFAQTQLGWQARAPPPPARPAMT